METKTKWFIGIGSALVLGITAFATKDLWMPKKASLTDPKSNPDGTNNANEILSQGSATERQFQKLADTAKSIGSDMFEGATASQLLTMRNSFTTKLSYKEADRLIALLNKRPSTWSVDEKIDYATLSNKIRIARPSTSQGQSQYSPSSMKPERLTYDVLSDTEYNSKIPVLDSWRSHLIEQQKKGVAGWFQKNVPSAKDFYKKFLPIKLVDLKQYTALAMVDKEKRTLKDEQVLSNLRDKYDYVFKGNVKIYSFDGILVDSELPNSNLINM